MTFVAPAALALAALAAPIVVLYMLRSRRARTRVPSTMLWDTGVHTQSANAPWQRVRFSWLLLLQLLALLLLVLAIARPARTTSVPLADHTVLIVDTSASMQADDGGRSRLESARRAALDAVEQLAPGRRMTVIDAGPRAQVVLSRSADRRAIVQALSSLKPTDGTTDASAAFSLGASLETADVPTILHFYSDGGTRPEDREGTPGNLVHLPIGRARGNVAVARLALGERTGTWEAFVRVQNSGTVRVDAALILEAAGRTILRRAVRVEPQSAADLAIPLPRLRAEGVIARVEDVRAAPGTVGTPSAADLNALGVDDRAYAVLHEAAGPRVLVVGPGNVFLESLVRSMPGARLSVSKEPVPVRGFDLVVYDRVDPPKELEAPALVIAPPGGAPGVEVSGTVKRPIPSFAQPREPILEHVDLSRLAVRIAQRARVTDLRTLVGTGTHPLLAIGVPGGRRMAYLAFDLRESNLPVQVSFPLLFGNLFGWLEQGDAAERALLDAGDPLPLRAPGRADRIEILTPGGARVERAVAGAIFDETERAGLYHIRYLAGRDAVAEETLAVNVPALESALAPKPITGPLEQRGAGAGSLRGLRAWGPGILAVALVVLLIEWWLAHGRPNRRLLARALERPAKRERAA